MAELATPLRKQLSKTIVDARRTAEAGARAALESLAVEHHEPHKEMAPELRQLRNRLRAHGRQLGDRRDKERGHQSIKRLAHEVAYAHWHHMLFSRFLAENNLLIHPEVGASVSLDDIRELAHEANENPDAMAARFAQAGLPQIFRTDDPVLEVQLAPNVIQELVRLLDSLPAAVFTADDSLGWTYQYWQSEKKDEVNAAGDKIGADELPAVTQLFTEHYMVLFLYHNTIGAWHAGKVLAENPELAETATSEDELRTACALKTEAGEKNWEYLRFVREPQEGDADDNPAGPWRPAAGTFEAWPANAKELEVLDPCCGSGHFLVVGFKLIVGLRMHEEGLGLEDAIRAVLAENLFGLELDQRCTQIAAFNVAMAAWKLAGKPIELPSLNIACSGLPIGSSRKEWLALADDDSRLQAGMENLYELFKHAPELGSLIDPSLVSGDMYTADFGELEPLLEKLLVRHHDLEDTERMISAKGMTLATGLLSKRYNLVITNVPYLGRGQQSTTLKSLADKNYKAAKADLAAIFLSRCAKLTLPGGTVTAVIPQNILFLDSYKGFRKQLLTDKCWEFVARLGEHSFQSTSAAGAFVAMLSFSHAKAKNGTYFSAVDASAVRGQKPITATEKPAILKGAAVDEELGLGIVYALNQLRQLKNPDSRITFHEPSELPTLESYTFCRLGLGTGDSPHYLRLFWELHYPAANWALYQTASSNRARTTGLSTVVAWDAEENRVYGLSPEERHQAHNQDYRGREAWGRNGVLIGVMGTLPASLYFGSKFDKSAAALVPKNDENLLALLAYATSDAYPIQVRKLDQKLMVTNATLAKVPFDLEHWQEVASKKYPTGLPQPYSEDPTQWLFHGYLAQADNENVFQVVVARLLGYRWPAELDQDIELSEEARELVTRCNKLKDFVDDDGIVCLSATRGEANAAARLRELLAAAFGADWSANKEKELLAAAAGDKKPTDSLEIWLRDKFFEEHCKLFQNRPFIWHLWDGHKDGFHCLVNAHKLTGPNGEGRKTLESITYSYLKGWIDRQREDQQQDVEGADAKLAAALDLQGQLEKILAGEPPYDLFVRWKPLHEQPMGWEPDINDGVRLNIRPFMNAELRKGGKKGAGILRAKPNIKWTKDRGKEPESLRPKEDFPWFWGASGDSKDDPIAERTDYTPEKATRAKFDGNRWNDLHFSHAVKEAAKRNEESNS